MERSLAAEARAVLGSARAWLEEFAEEGLEQVAAPPAASAAATTVSQPEPESSMPARAAEAANSAAARSTAPDDAGSASLTAVREELGECTRCGLHAKRSQIVFGDGDPNADLLFVGEGPGEQEDRQGVPFVGRAGELLTQMIEKGLGIPRSSVYICNIVKCRPPGNRTPRPEEAATCSPFLDAQIAAVKPKVIVTLGKPATSLLLGRDVAITRERGTWHEYRGTPLMPTLHPAYVLRQYTPETRKNVWNDLKAALARSRGES